MAEVQIVRVPGAFEVPVMASRLAREQRADVVIALGVIIRGATAHADLISTAVTHGLQTIAVETGTPVIHEVLLLERNDAEARCLGTELNRGTEAARAAAAMADVGQQLNPTDS